MYRTEAAIILQQEVLDSIVCFVLFCFVLFSCVLFCFVSSFACLFSICSVFSGRRLREFFGVDA